MYDIFGYTDPIKQMINTTGVSIILICMISMSIILYYFYKCIQNDNKESE